MSTQTYEKCPNVTNKSRSISDLSFHDLLAESIPVTKNIVDDIFELVDGVDIDLTKRLKNV